MTVEIGDEKVQEAGDGKNEKYQVISEICNSGSSDVTVKVTQHPYDKDDKKIGENQKTTVTIPANQCVSVVFEVPREKKPHETYTDVYDEDDKVLDGEINALQPKKAGAGSTGGGGGGGSYGYYGGSNLFTFATPLPWRILEAFGEQWEGEFYIESVIGEPPGWTVEVLDPPIGTPFTRTAYDRESRGVIKVTTPLDVAEGTVVFLDIVQRVVGAPDEILYRLDQKMKIVVDRTPPQELMSEAIPDAGARTILVRAQGLDTVSGIRQMRVRYSADNGQNWAEATLFPPSGSPPSENPIFEGTIGPFCAGQSIRTEVSMTDHADNTNHLAEKLVQF